MNKLFKIGFAILAVAGVAVLFIGLFIGLDVACGWALIYLLNLLPLHISYTFEKMFFTGLALILITPNGSHFNTDRLADKIANKVKNKL